MKTKHTPGPWSVDPHHAGDKELFIGEAGATVDIDDCTTDERNQQFANARLIAASPDHALFARGVTSGKARWNAWDSLRGEVGVGGILYSTELDEFGCPVLTTTIREALIRHTT